MLNDQQFIRGDELRDLYKRTNVRLWPVEEGPDDGYHVSPSAHETTTLEPDEVLHTRQSHLHRPTFERYLAGDVPTHDPHDPDVPYLPEVVEYRGSSRWISEGHHRIVAGRLRGDDIEAWVGRRDRRRPSG